MAGLVHFLVLVSVALGAGAAVLGWPSRPTWRRALVAAVSIPPVTALVALASVHACDAGQPVAQWVVPALAAVPVLLFVGSVPVRAALAASLAFVGLTASLDYAQRVHDDDWSGRPELQSRGELLGLEQARLELSRRDEPIDAGPVAEVAVAVGVPAWHSPLTGLYPKRPATLVVSTGGGSRDAAARSLRVELTGP